MFKVQRKTAKNIVPVGRKTDIFPVGISFSAINKE
jgi:hypothetical protein